jgi:phosphotriesterase-related protein
MVKKIMTTAGPIAPEELGWTSMHEHILMNGRVLRNNMKPIENPPIPPEEPMSIENVGLISHNGMLTYDAVDLQDEALMLAEVGDFKAWGGDAMPEVSAVGIRCNVPGVKRIADATGVKVVACTGFYVRASWPEEWRDREFEDYRAFMMSEVRDGIEGTGVFPGLVKIATSQLEPDEERALRAGARVAAETGLSLTIHPSRKVGVGPAELVGIAKEEGLAPERVVVAHMGSGFVEKDLKTLVTRPESWKLNLDEARRLLDTGATFCTEFLGQNVADEIGGTVGSTDWQRLAGVYALIDEGYQDQIVLGTDTCAKMLTRRFGGEGYLRLLRFVLPTMRDILNVHERVLRKIFVENPARILAY